MTGSRWHKISLLVFFVATAVFSAVLMKFGFMDDGAIRAIRARIDGFGPYSPLIFIAIIAVASNFFIPMSLLITSGGILYGAQRGFLYSFLGATLSVLIGYSLYRYAGLKGRSDVNARIPRLIEGIQGRGIFAVILIRLLAIPFAAQNFAGSAMNVPFRSYLTGSVIGMTPWLVGFSFFGDSIIGLKYQIAVLSLFLLFLLYLLAFRLTS